MDNNFLCEKIQNFISSFLQARDEFIIRPDHSTRKYFRRKLLLVYYQFSSSCPVKQLAKWLILPLLGIFSPLLDYHQGNLNAGIIINNKTRWQTRNHFSNNPHLRIWTKSCENLKTQKRQLILPSTSTSGEEQVWMMCWRKLSSYIQIIYSS